jgi:hypothetical protein
MDNSITNTVFFSEFVYELVVFDVLQNKTLNAKITLPIFREDTVFIG